MLCIPENAFREADSHVGFYGLLILWRLQIRKLIQRISDEQQELLNNSDKKTVKKLGRWKPFVIKF